MSSGILITRLIGLVRQRIFSRVFGLSYVADAFYGAFRIPNLLQNLFGEGVLSASFIPVYSKLLAEGDEEEAGRVAGAVAAILALTTAVLVLLGVLAAPLVTDIVVGASRDRRGSSPFGWFAFYSPGNRDGQRRGGGRGRAGGAGAPHAPSVGVRVDRAARGRVPRQPPHGSQPRRVPSHPPVGTVRAPAPPAADGVVGLARHAGGWASVLALRAAMFD